MRTEEEIRRELSKLLEKSNELEKLYYSALRDGKKYNAELISNMINNTEFSITILKWILNDDLHLS